MKLEDKYVRSLLGNYIKNQLSFKISEFCKSDKNVIRNRSLYILNTNDFNPIYSIRRTCFNRKVLYGALKSSLVSGLLGIKLSAKGEVYLKKILKPIYFDEL